VLFPWLTNPAARGLIPAANRFSARAIGRIAWEEKLEGMLVPSARELDGTNLALFPGRRRKGSSWRIQGARDLP
jgi:hypothetical protein